MAPAGPTVEMRILVVDDDPDVLRALEKYLKARGHRVCTAGGGAEGLEVLAREPFDVVFTDFRMPGTDGFEVLREARRLSPGTEVVVITAHGDVESAVRAMREGAFDFLAKPLQLEDLDSALHRTARYQSLRREKDRCLQRLDEFRVEDRGRHGLSAIVGLGPAIHRVKELIETVCQTDATTVLILGETGTGKELVARAVHAESARAAGPFVPVDCWAIPPTLVESELYGHEKGAFTDARESRRGRFEQADGGTLFLDEIGNMGPAVQAKLLRALEERAIRRIGAEREIAVNARVVSATNRDLVQSVASGTFREDLFYRLNVFTIRLPALRDRKEDIVPLARHFLDRYARELRKPIRGFAPRAEALLEAHAFPGNVRELRNMVERAAILCKADCIAPGDLDFQRESAAGIFDPTRLGSLDLGALERAVVREALRRSGENQTQAAKLLKITRRQLATKLKNDST